MLTPGYLAGLPAPMVELYSQLESDIVCDMARRISKMGAVTETANYQAWRLEQLAGFQKSTQKKLARMTGKTERQLRAMFRQAARDAVAADSVIYEAAGLSPKPPSKNAALNQIVQACEKQTLGVFENLTRTTANTATRQFERALDRAALQIGSGAFDYRTAIRRAVKDLSGQGIETIVYSKGGRVTQRAHLDVAVRRAVLTGVNQMAAQVSLANAQLLGCDLVETTAHQGARPEHTEWQGKIFSISGRHPKYPQLAKATGYGTGDGLCGWNCRHSFYPYFEGLSEPAYTKESLDDMAAATVFYNGEELTQYDASQRQRAIERNIRRWKREYLAMEAAGEDTTEAALKLKKWRAVQADFCRQTGLRADGFRGQVVGFGRSQASKATVIAQEWHLAWIKSINAQDSEFRSLAKYYEEKYNNSPSYRLLRQYAADVKSGWLSPLSGFTNYRNLYNRLQNEVVGKTAANGTVITGQVPHFMQRVVGTLVDPKKLKENLQIIRRSGVSVEDIEEALFSPEKVGKVLLQKSGKRSIKLYGSNCAVAINPDTGMLIQTNPRGSE